MDQFHTRGHAATADLAELAGIGPADRVLDLGCGIGGPARLIAERRGYRVVGVDLSEDLVESTRYLSQRTGRQERVEFHGGSALALDFIDASFDIVLLQHVAMNIADRAGLYREIRRLLVPDGRFATYDAVRGVGEPRYSDPRCPRKASVARRQAAEACYARCSTCSASRTGAVECLSALKLA